MFWVEGDAEALPIETNSMDGYTIAFGIRNCTHIDRVLKEAHRVLRKVKSFPFLSQDSVNLLSFSNQGRKVYVFGV